MSPSLELALSWTERLTALAVILQTLELLTVRRAFADDGVWRWSILRDEHVGLPLPLRWAFRFLLPYHPFLALLALRLLLAVAMAAGVGVAAWAMAMTQLAVGARFRGTFNGGSDYMTMVLLLGLSAAALPGAAAPRIGLGYICVQLVLSYFIAGLVKLRQPAWRAGSALRSLLSSNRYGTPAWVTRFVPVSASRWLCWAVMGLELGCPIALVRAGLALPFVTAALLFHLANTAVFGLNRFLFAWVAAYPALLHFSTALDAA